MSKSNSAENGWLALLFNNSAFANIGDAGGLQPSAVAGSLYVSLHTGDPGEAGDQTTNECAYTSYARVAVARSGAGWTVSGNQASNTAQVQFPASTGGSETATHIAIGTATSGTGVLLYSGALDASLAIGTGVQPTFAIGALVASED